MSLQIRQLTDADIQHRESFKEFVFSHAETWHREHLSRLYEVWESANARFFGGEMVTPYIILNVPSSTRSLGDCSVVSAFGGRSQIRIRPSILRGSHPSVRPGSFHAEGRFRFTADILLHEMIHQWQQEITGKMETSYKGHGPAFRDKANEIGSLIGLSPVRVAKARGMNKSLPSCAHWPHCVRPADFYFGAVVSQFPEPNLEGEGEGKPVRTMQAKLLALESLMAAAKAYYRATLRAEELEVACERLCESAYLFGEQS